MITITDNQHEYEYYFSPEAIRACGTAYGFAAPIVRRKGFPKHSWAWAAYKIIDLTTGVVIKDRYPTKPQRYRSIDDPSWEVGE